MKRFEGILICTDLDGTLLREDGTVSKENMDAIAYFQKRGGLFTFITGRMPYFAADIYEMIQPNAPFGCINGGGIYDHRKGEYLWRRPISRDCLDLVDLAYEKVPGIGIQVNGFEHLYFATENSAMVSFREKTGVPNLVCPYREVQEDFGKILFGDEREEAIQALAHLLPTHPKAGQFDFIRSEQTLYEILPKGTNKGSLLPRLAALLGIDMKRTVAFGDYNNDVQMLKVAGLGVAVANAVPEAKAAADLVTVSNEENAIAAVIDGLDKGTVRL